MSTARPLANHPAACKTGKSDFSGQAGHTFKLGSSIVRSSQGRLLSEQATDHTRSQHQIPSLADRDAKLLYSLRRNLAVRLHDTAGNFYSCAWVAVSLASSMRAKNPHRNDNGLWAFVESVAVEQIRFTSPECEVDRLGSPSQHSDCGLTAVIKNNSNPMEEPHESRTRN